MEKEDTNGTVVIIPRISHFTDDNGVTTVERKCVQTYTFI